MYRVKFPVGDWSVDGHDKCDWYILESSVPVEQLREIYFKAYDAGMELDGHSSFKFCKDYKDSCVPEETITAITEFTKGLWTVDLLEDHDPDDYEDGFYHITSNDIINIFIAVCKTVEPSLKLSVVNDDIPRFPFYGFKDKRHIGYFGYGLFY